MSENGKVKWFNVNKGYGFIEGEDGKEYFVHISATDGVVLKTDEQVQFDINMTDKGPQAINVKK